MEQPQKHVRARSDSTAAPAASRKKQQRLVRQIVSSWQTQAIYVAAQLGIADHLARRPATAESLAEALDCSSDGLTRLLRGLCALGICRQRVDDRFALTPAGRLLCSDDGSPHGVDDATSLRALALWWGKPLWPVWGDLLYSVRTGASARERLTGEADYAYLKVNSQTASAFHEAMRAMTALIARDVAQLETWRNVGTLVDVGGGHGELAAAILVEHPQLQGIIFDLPHAKAGAEVQIETAGLTERCQFHSGSFFDEIPDGADRYVLKSILHNWNDERCAAILARCRDAAAVGTRLLLVERLRPVRLRANAHDEALARTDLNMLAGLGGRERTLDEFAALLHDAGFTMLQTHQTGFEFSVIEAGVR